MPELEGRKKQELHMAPEHYIGLAEVHHKELELEIHRVVEGRRTGQEEEHHIVRAEEYDHTVQEELHTGAGEHHTVLEVGHIGLEELVLRMVGAEEHRIVLVAAHHMVVDHTGLEAGHRMAGHHRKVVDRPSQCSRQTWREKGELEISKDEGIESEERAGK